MYKCKIENVRGSVITLTQNESDFQVYDIKGLNPPKAQINTSSIAGLDGAKFNSSKLGTRNIVIYIKLNNNVEANRIMLYRYVPTKEWCKFYYENESRNVYVEAYVESVEVTPFSKDEVMQISLICPNAYLKNIDEIVDDISKSLAAFEFPFAFGSNGATNPYALIDTSTDNAIPFSTIDMSRITNVYNNSESETGVIIEIDTMGTVNTIQIRNTETGDTFTLNYNFIENDKITIDTNKGQKSIKLLRNGVTSNLFTAVRKGSTFFQLAIGDNFFGYTGDDGDSDDVIHIIFKHYTVYRGV